MKQNRLILAITYSLVALFSLISISTEAQNTSKTIKRIIIDPGHGGSDPGSNGKYSTEAAVSLAISLKLEEYINQSIPDVEVVLTRRTDIYNSVVEKANIANAAKGDLFICIHTNSFYIFNFRYTFTPLFVCLNTYVHRLLMFSILCLLWNTNHNTIQ